MEKELLKSICEQFDFAGTEQMSGFTAKKVVLDEIEHFNGLIKTAMSECDHELSDVYYCNEDGIGFEFIECRCRKCGYVVDFC